MTVEQLAAWIHSVMADPKGDIFGGGYIEDYDGAQDGGYWTNIDGAINFRALALRLTTDVIDKVAPGAVTREASNV